MLLQPESAEVCSDRCETSIINPLLHPSWDLSVASIDNASFFHRACWARVLNETYGHTPMYFCKLRQDALEQVIPLMEVSSRWTGRRGVSLPFTDFCPSVNVDGEPSELWESALKQGKLGGLR